MNSPFRLDGRFLSFAGEANGGNLGGSLLSPLIPAPPCEPPIAARAPDRVMPSHRGRNWPEWRGTDRITPCARRGMGNLGSIHWNRSTSGRRFPLPEARGGRSMGP